MHRVLIELQDNVAAALLGLILAAYWVLYMKRDSLETRKDLVKACVMVILGAVALGWLAYMLAYSKKVFITDPSFSVNWNLALEFFRGGRGVYPIRSYSVAMASAFAINIALIHRRAPIDGVNRETAMNAAVATIIGTLLGGRILFVITQWADYAEQPWRVFAFWEGGLVFYGGFIGSFVCVMFYMYVIRREAFLPLADMYAVYAGFGLAIHRTFGCFMNGCCYGGPTTAPWGVRFPIDHVGTQYFGLDAYLHPTQLYESVNGLSIFFTLLIFRRYRKYYGQNTAILLMMYAVNRYIVELFRGDLLRGEVGAFSTSQFIGMVTFAVGAALMAYAHIAKRPIFRLEPVEAVELASAQTTAAGRSL